MQEFRRNKCGFCFGVCTGLDLYCGVRVFITQLLNIFYNNAYILTCYIWSCALLRYIAPVTVLWVGVLPTLDRLPCSVWWRDAGEHLCGRVEYLCEILGTKRFNVKWLILRLSNLNLIHMCILIYLFDQIGQLEHISICHIKKFENQILCYNFYNQAAKNMKLRWIYTCLKLNMYWKNHKNQMTIRYGRHIFDCSKTRF